MESKQNTVKEASASKRPQPVNQEDSSTLENGKRTKCVEKEPTITVTDRSIEVNGRTTNIVDVAYFNSPTGLSTKESGKTTSCMELDSLLTIPVESGEGSSEKGNSRAMTRKNLSRKKPSL